MKAFFWILLFIIFYSYIGYTLLLLIIYCIKKVFFSKYETINQDYEPEIVMFVPAFNEREIIEDKIENTMNLDYPAEKIKQLWVIDGSNDGSEEILRQHSGIEVLFQPVRQGKINAMNRGMQYVKAPIVVFSDTNSILSPNSIKEIVRLFANPEVGCVAGEKRIFTSQKDNAVISGEGTYWLYESIIKKLESELNSTMGAAGELFAIRTRLFEPVERDTILDDFVISLKIAKKGYKIKYASNAFAYEKGSASIKDEMKRKIRIASGGLQTLLRMKELLNIFEYGFLSFQYISHKVSRWVAVPFAFVFLLLSNIYIVTGDFNPDSLYFWSLILQALFYLFVMTGHILSERKIRQRYVFIPYYLFIMNYSLILGILRYLRGKQPVNWEKARRN